MILRATYKSRGLHWEGVVKDEAGKVVWTCGHPHKNRDHGREDYGGSAVGCAKAELTRRGMGEDERGFVDRRSRWLPGNKVEIAA